MDFLSQLIEEKCSAKLWNPMKASQSGPTFSHLLFVNNLVFFAKADYVNCLAIREALDHFCRVSGQTASDAKSRVYFSPNVDRDTRESLSDILGFTTTPFLGKYLGIPLKQPGSSSRDYNYILDRVKQKLARWKANVLSLAGRTMLIQASSTSVPAYVMQCSQLPCKVLDGIDRVNRNFLWGSSEVGKKSTRLAGRKSPRLKKKGG